VKLSVSEPFPITSEPPASGSKLDLIVAAEQRPRTWGKRLAVSMHAALSDQSPSASAPPHGVFAVQEDSAVIFE